MNMPTCCKIHAFCNTFGMGDQKATAVTAPGEGMLKPGIIHHVKKKAAPYQGVGPRLAAGTLHVSSANRASVSFPGPLASI